MRISWSTSSSSNPDPRLEADFNVEVHVAEFDAEQVDAAVAGDGFGQDFLIGGFHVFVHEPGGEGLFDR
jgi:hypothetical protein